MFYFKFLTNSSHAPIWHISKQNCNLFYSEIEEEGGGGHEWRAYPSSDNACDAEEAFCSRNSHAVITIGSANNTCTQINSKYASSKEKNIE